MSLLDGMLEEDPDPEWCQTHACEKPCEHCADEAADRAYDSRREARA